jgi:hypothetical protein
MVRPPMMAGAVLIAVLLPLTFAVVLPTHMVTVREPSRMSKESNVFASTWAHL